jgi:hypothetical protein
MNPYSELGTTALPRFGGHVTTEALRELQGEQGRQKYREMRLNDPVIAAIFFAVGHTLRQSTWRVTPVSDKEPDIIAAEFLESCIDDMSFSWSDTMTFIIDPMLEQGFSLLELVYKKRLGDKPGAYVKEPAKSKYSDGRIGWRKWAPRPAESLMPGNEWIIDEAGGIKGINQLDQYATGQYYSVPIEKMLHFRTTVHPANTPEPPPIHRAAYLPYHYTKNIMEIEGIGIERDLAGLPVVYLGNDRTTQGSDSDYELAKDLVTNIRVDEQAGVVIPGPKMGGGAAEGNGWLLELLSSGGSRSYDTTAIIDRYDRRKAMIVLAQFVMLGMQNTGSYALSRHQGDLFTLAASAWLHNIADIINRHAVPRLFSLNTFSGLTELPKLQPSPLGLPNLEQIAEYVNKLVDKQVLTPDNELERHLRQIADLPELTETDGDTLRKGNPESESILLSRLRTALEPMLDLGLIAPDELDGLLRPTLEKLQHSLGQKAVAKDNSGPVCKYCGAEKTYKRGDGLVSCPTCDGIFDPAEG